MNVVIETAYATFRAEPQYGRPVTFEVREREVDVASRNSWRKNVQTRYVVGLKGSDGGGFAHFISFEKACASALSRCRRFEKAYSEPRGVAVRREGVAA